MAFQQDGMAFQQDEMAFQQDEIERPRSASLWEGFTGMDISASSTWSRRIRFRVAIALLLMVGPVTTLDFTNVSAGPVTSQDSGSRYAAAETPSFAPSFAHPDDDGTPPDPALLLAIAAVALASGTAFVVIGHRRELADSQRRVD